MTPPVRISALTVTHNRAMFLRECVASVLSQTYPVYEYVIIDDGSDDDTEAVVASFNDPRIKYFRYERIGRLPKLRNLAVSKASGEFAAFIDSDDRWHPEKLAMHLQACLEKTADISVSDSRYFNENGFIGASIGEGLTASTDVFHELLYKNRSFAFGTNLFFRISIDGKRQRFDETLNAGDHDFMMMMCAQHRSAYVPATLNLIRKHRGNMSSENPVMRAAGTIEYNVTLTKLLGMKKISPETFRKISGTNLVKTGAEYARQNKRNKALRLIWSGLLRNPAWSHFKVMLKAAFYRL